MLSITATRPEGSDRLAVEAWGKGLIVGSLIVMIAVTGTFSSIQHIICLSHNDSIILERSINETPLCIIC
jgi:hypothetical protein